MAIIENLNTPWNGHTGLEVETFIKNYLEQISAKVGYIYIEETDDESNLCCFANESAYNQWASDPVNNSHLLIGGKQKLPAGSGVSSAYSATLEMIDPSKEEWEMATNTGNVKVKVR